MVDRANVAELALVPLDDVLVHADVVAVAEPGPKDLYERWERQQWSADAIELGPDAADLRKRFPRAARQQISTAVSTFIIGEYTALDRLGPILAAAPDEDALLFLGTQIADEARHTRVMFRIGEEVLGLDPRPQQMLNHAWELAGPAHRELDDLETALVNEVKAAPGDYVSWLRAVTVFHLVTEGVLALVGQRALVHSLRGTPLLAGVRSAFTAMCRDESRHVAFGLHALREGVRAGHGEAIYDVVETAVPIALRIGGEGSDEVHAMMRQMSMDSLRRELTHIGAPPEVVQRLSAGSTRRAEAATRAAAVSAAELT